MTEHEWLTCADPAAMLRQLGTMLESVSPRKARLFACACCRRIWGQLVRKASRQAVIVTEQFVDGTASEKALARAAEAAGNVTDRLAKESEREAANAAYRVADEIDDDLIDAEDSSRSAAFAAAHAVDEKDENSEAWGQRYRQELAAQADLVRDIFGNPFHPTTVSPSWLAPVVIALAQATYQDRALPSGELEPARLAVLSDALEEAGCADADILSHRW